MRRHADEVYLRWAVDAFRIATSGVRDDTQIHTHMCYSEFGDILPAIVEMDADVLSIETSRSKTELLADCGLKTRGWAEGEASLTNMVEAARRVRLTVPGKSS